MRRHRSKKHPGGLLSPRRTIPWWVKQRLWHSACEACGSGHEIQIDHIIPRSHGGPHNEENLQALCRWCNGAKGGRLMCNEDIAWHRIPRWQRRRLLKDRSLMDFYRVAPAPHKPESWREEATA